MKKWFDDEEKYQRKCEYEYEGINKAIKSNKESDLSMVRIILRKDSKIMGMVVRRVFSVE